MRVNPRWSLLVASATAALAMGQVQTARASAATPQPDAQHTVSGVPLRGAAQSAPVDGLSKNLDYNGGPLMPSNTDYLVFWSPGGLGAYGSGSIPEYVSGLEQYFRDLAHDSGGHQNVDSVSAQYNDLTGAFARYDVTFGGGLLDTDPYPASQCPVQAPVVACVTDLQIQQELEHFVTARHLKKDLSHEYFLMSPPHVESCFSNNPSTGFDGCSAGELPSTLAAFCAYHGNTTLSPMLFYADDPFVTDNPGCDDGNHPNGPSDGALQGGLSHEHNESITDPIPNDAWTNGHGKNHGLELGDLCDGANGTPLGRAANGAKFNQVINGHSYWYQEEWSNQTHSCLQRLNPEATPAATFTVSAGSGLTMTFDATGSTAPGGVEDYAWQFNDAFGASTTERATPTIRHTFPAAGDYSVGLTVFAHDGSSTGTGGIIRTGHDGITPGFTATPGHAGVGQAVQFSALNRVSRQPVITYFWDFGDGSTAASADPRHAYTKAGTYTVTLVMFSGIGSAFPGAGAAPVSTRTIIVR